MTSPPRDSQNSGCLAVSLCDIGLQRRQQLSAFLGLPVLPNLFIADKTHVVAHVGWGMKPSGVRAASRAKKDNKPCWRLEDGFLRSLGLGNQEPPLSIVVDDEGIHYDATHSSRLEKFIAESLSPEKEKRATALIAAWRNSRVSKYNHLREYTAELPARYVLVVDQTFGDASIRFGLADAASFQRMLDTALKDNPDCLVLLKIHPDVFAGRKRGYFDVAHLRSNPRVQVLAENVHPVRILEHAHAVYVVTSQMGFEGLLWGKPVYTFGMPFYAGWGLTHDALPAPERRKTVPLENLVHAALVIYPRYIEPESGKRCEVEQVMEWVALQRRTRERFPPTVYALGFSPWKEPIIRDFVQGSEARFVNQLDEVPACGTLLVWGRNTISVTSKKDVNESHLPPQGEGRDGGGVVALHRPHPHPGPPLEGEGEQFSVSQLIRIEDGFLRSVGLGADLVRPLSWVLDRRGMYYDATAPSDLEHLLQTAQFDGAQIERARRLHERIVEHGLTKYNVGAARWRRPEGGKRVILVPGQVESDASIRFGAPDIRTNMGLLRAVREANPNAYVVYKPHPDVHSGCRLAGDGESEAGRYCDEVVIDVDMGALLQVVDEVHVLTSLAGFEALLRGKRVTTYGQPFYAGWGLTQDMRPPSRRTRHLTLDELIAGVLIEYPTYVSRTTGRFTTPERALDELLAWRASPGAQFPWWRKLLRRILQLRRN